MRYLPLSAEDRAVMLHKIGVSSIDELFADVPKAAWLDGPVDLPTARSEIEVERAMGRMARRNLAAGDAAFFVGAGAYRHHVPASVDHLIQRSEFLTSYTPYQPEISQGTLQVLFEFQTQVCELTGMEVANASMYDGSTATAEAVLMAHRLTKRGKAVIAGNLHPHYSAVVETTSRLSSHETVFLDPTPGGGEDLVSSIDDATSCVVVQTPDVFGHPVDLAPIAEAAHEKGALLIAVVTEPVSLGLIEPPGAMGADIVVGEGQGIGNGLNFGGPYVGLFATRSEVPAADAGPRLRRDRRRRGQARLRAHPVDPRAAHPPREGDLEHLHELGPVRARLLDPPDAARRHGAQAARPAQPRPRREARRRAGGRAGRRNPERAPSSTSSRCGFRSPPPRSSRRSAGRACSAACR